MGTNYDWIENDCHFCGRSDRLHIGKSYRMFEGHWHYDLNGEIVWDIASWQDWKDRFLNGHGWIVDEYGAYVNIDHFIAKVEAVPVEDRRRQYDAVAAGWPGRASDDPEPQRDWLDAEGFSFYGGEFS